MRHIEGAAVSGTVCSAGWRHSGRSGPGLLLLLWCQLQAAASSAAPCSSTRPNPTQGSQACRSIHGQGLAQVCSLI